MSNVLCIGGGPWYAICIMRCWSFESMLDIWGGWRCHASWPPSWYTPKPAAFQHQFKHEGIYYYWNSWRYQPSGHLLLHDPEYATFPSYLLNKVWNVSKGGKWRSDVIAEVSAARGVKVEVSDQVIVDVSAQVSAKCLLTCRLNGTWKWSRSVWTPLGTKLSAGW